MPSTADVFAILWSTLVDVLGSAAAAALLRRAARRARDRLPELGELRIVRERWGYRYVAPVSWHTQRLEDTPELSDMVLSELCPILQDLTGSLVVRQLEAVPELSDLLLSRSRS